MAVGIMGKIEQGEIKKERSKRREREREDVFPVYQTDFKILNGLDPLKNEAEIYDKLQNYERNQDVANAKDVRPRITGAESSDAEVSVC